ncbi:electron transport complex, RnfABCDGE type, D subunit [Pseudoflavonifractor capillosus ATCC 29799]|uniref:Ion-translocating oxidoreductase complex subunit D n=1 Tax=Pseudoflavonifractor capillosus ATCC 29799 TaxID=411467 RepID=A6NPN1_9FIRM|nr:RnfABCDGE type electron transport complex subunit D [Pseudoflavonifractor capillosus]EDN02113.1 electron transport complex, RnfABCDGE type, D subunit [Pseudoflavonifractor capillosus ATCC 29799]
MKKKRKNGGQQRPQQAQKASPPKPEKDLQPQEPEQPTPETAAAPVSQPEPVPERQAEAPQVKPEPARTQDTPQPPKKAEKRAEQSTGSGLERPLTIASAPHLTTRDTTRTLMLDVLIALMPALLFSGCYFFGPRAFLVTLVSAAGCVGFEALFCLITRRRQTVDDLSAVVTGVLLAFTLPANVPYWAVLLGDFFAIVVVKQLFGGLGKNFLNPALAGRAFLFSFPAVMSAFPAVRSWEGFAIDAQSAATPMASLHAGSLPSVSLLEMFTGVRSGSLGEVSAALLLLGGLYLLARRVIRLRIPLSFLGTVAVLSWCFPQGGNSSLDWTLYSLMGGGLLLAAFFMATDFTTSPVTFWGQVVCGVGCGALTVFRRTFGSYPEGVGFAVLVMNLLAWPIDRAALTLRSVFRRRKEARA